MRPLFYAFSPGSFDRIDRRQVTVAGLMLIALNVCLGWALLPIVLDRSPFAGSPLIALVIGLQIAIVVGALLVRWLVLMYVASSIGAIAGGAVKRLPYFAVVLVADVAELAQSAFLVLLIWLKGPSAVHTEPRIGLNLVFGELPMVMNGLLNELNIFTAWYFVIAVAGFRKVAGLRLRPALVTVGALWLLQLSLVAMQTALRL